MKILRFVWLYFKKSPWYMWIFRFALAYLIFFKWILPKIKGGP